MEFTVEESGECLSLSAPRCVGPPRPKGPVQDRQASAAVLCRGLQGFEAEWMTAAHEFNIVLERACRSNSV